MGVLVVDDAKLILNDGFPGLITQQKAFPATLQEWSDTEDYKVGTKFARYCTDNKGWSIFTFLRLIKGSTDVDIAVKDPCGVDADGNYYDVTNDGGDINVNGPIAFPLAALDYGVSFTAAGKTFKYGWFWTGGVCPVSLVKNAAGTKVLDGNFVFVAGAACTLGDGLKLADVAGASCDLKEKEATDLTPAAAICNETVTAS